MATVEQILSRFARQVSSKSRMEYDDAYQELAIAEFKARDKFDINYVTKSGEWATYETYLRSVLEGVAMKLVIKDNKKACYSLDEMLDNSDQEDAGGRSIANQRYIAFEELSYRATDWQVVINQVAEDEIDKFIFEMLIQGWRQSDIAEMLEYSQPAVRQRLNRYKEKMALALA